MKCYGLVATIVSILALPTVAAERESYTYKMVGDRELETHVVRPDGHAAGADAPALIFFHGGGFRQGSPRQGIEYGEFLAEHGVVTITVEYRFTGDPATLDQLIADAKSSVRWAREHAHELGIDADRVIASGHSAGAYLAAATQMLTGFDEPDENANVSSQPNTMVLWSPAVARTESNTRSVLPPGANLANYLPARNVIPPLPPTIFIHGTADDLVPKEVSIDLNDEFVAAGVDSQLYLIDGVDHFFRDPQARAQVKELLLGFISDLGYLN